MNCCAPVFNSKSCKIVNCRMKGILNTKYCIIHYYMTNYSASQKENLTLCNFCYKLKHINEGSRCEKCVQMKNTKIDLCVYENCRNIKSDLNEYCTRHQMFITIQEAENTGKKLCANFIKLQCPNLLERHDAYRSCLACRERGKNSISSTLYNKNPIIFDNIGEKKCSACCKNLPINEFLSFKKNTFTSVCQICRDKRSDRYHNLKRKYNPT